MSLNRIAAAALLVLAGTLSYAVYWDHKRRSDPTFRRRLKKSRKQAAKESNASSPVSGASGAPAAVPGLPGSRLETADLKALIDKALVIADITDPKKLPREPAALEAFFMAEVQEGETSVDLHPNNPEIAAAHFYRAIVVYPTPVDLIMIYQKTVPQHVFNIIMGMMSREMQRKADKYYEMYPPKDMGVKLVMVDEGVVSKDGTKIMRRALVTHREDDKDGVIVQGDVAFTEDPVVCMLDPRLDATHFCHHCMGVIAAAHLPESGDVITCADCGAGQVRFCSNECHDAAVATYHPAMCTRAVLLQEETSTLGETELQAATAARELLTRSCAESSSMVPYMVARLFAKHITEEKRRAQNGVAPSEYGLWEHVDRLRYLDIKPSEAEVEELRLITQMLKTQIPEIEAYITEERYLELKGKLLYNLVGVHCAEEHRVTDYTSTTKDLFRGDDKNPIIGAALYIFASYPRHSCTPNAVLRFNDSNGVRKHHASRLSVIALHPIKAVGEELRVAWVPTYGDGTGKTGAHGNLAAWRRLRLAQHWRFACECERCMREVKEQAAVDAEKEAAAEEPASPNSLADSGEMVDYPASEEFTTVLAEVDAGDVVVESSESYVMAKETVTQTTESVSVEEPTSSGEERGIAASMIMVEASHTDETRESNMSESAVMVDAHVEVTSTLETVTEESSLIEQTSVMAVTTTEGELSSAAIEGAVAAAHPPISKKKSWAQVAASSRNGSLDSETTLTQKQATAAGTTDLSVLEAIETDTSSTALAEVVHTEATEESTATSTTTRSKIIETVEEIITEEVVEVDEDGNERILSTTVQRNVHEVPHNNEEEVAENPAE